MPDEQERHYNINKLNRLFAAASIVLFFALIWLFMDDYSRSWKKYQKAFRDLELEKTRVKFDSESHKLQKTPEYQEIKEKITAAQNEISEQCADREAVTKSLLRLQAENDLLKHNYKIKIAELDATRYRYEDAVHKKENLALIEPKFQTMETSVQNLKLKVEESDRAIADNAQILAECDSKLKELKRQESNLTKPVGIFERKLRRIDPAQMTLGNYLADLIRDLPVIDLASPNYKIEQIVLKDLTDDVNFMRVPKVDRCITCHLGVLNPDYKDMPQPLRTHPNLELFLSNNSPHPLEEFGCTSCHGGRGRGTDFNNSAHTPSSEAQKKEWEKKYHWKSYHHWETPMYSLPYVEAGCFKCHAGETVIKGAEKLNLGLNFIEKAGCYACHAIDRYKNWPKPGPDLTHLSAKVSQEWTYRWIHDPKAFRHNTWMPAFFNQSNNDDPDSRKRGEQEIHAMVHYLFSVSEEFELPSMPTWEDPKKGEEIVSSLGCFACHNIQSEPVAAPRTQESLRREHGPNLTGLGTKTTKVWIYNWLKDPNRYHPETRMPNLRLSDEEAANAAAYLATDTDSDLLKEPIPSVDGAMVEDIAKGFMMKAHTVQETQAQLANMKLEDKLFYAGEKLIAHYGCFSCHNIKGFEDYKPIGVDLTEEGSKALERLDFGFIHIDHSKTAWFEQKLKDPRIFDHGKVKLPEDKLRMPNFNFTEEETQAITTALLGFVKDKPEPGKLKPQTPENIYIEEGQEIIRQFNCQGCHLIEGEGATIQPTVTQWLMAFDNRTEGDAQALTPSFSPPNLIGEGKKVRTEWLFNFLHQPAVVRPWLKVRMPTYHFNAAHLNSLVKYFNALDREEFPYTEKVDTALTSEELIAGEKLFSNEYFGCAQCHIVGDKMPAGSQESWAPNFALARTRLKPEWISQWLKDPQALLPGTKMPTFFDPANFDTAGPEDIWEGDEHKQIEVLRNYILTLSSEESTKRVTDQEILEPQPAADHTQ